jgi:hypothetical protein
MKRITELERRESPIPKPQSIVADGKTLFVGSRQTKQIVALDVATWRVTWETTAPGVPYGMTLVNGELRVVCGETAEDNRIIRRCVPYQGFDGSWGIGCPDDTGSQLSFDGRRLHVSQWYPKKVIALSADGKPERVMRMPHEICGQVWALGALHLLTTDNEETTDYWITRVNSADPVTTEDIAHVPFHARALAYDGTDFWTNHREQNQIVRFAV